MMIIRSSISGLVTGVLVISAGSALAGSGNFTGSFSGFYAPANWNITLSGNPTYQSSATVSTAGAPNSVTITGANSLSGPVVTPYSVINYSTTIQGSTVGEAESVSFYYNFFNPSAIPNGAQVLDNGLVVGTLTTGSSQFVMPSGFVAGSTLGIQVTSGNNLTPDVLQISPVPVPEPSALALTILGGASLLWQLRRKSGRS